MDIIYIHEALEGDLRAFILISISKLWVQAINLSTGANNQLQDYLKVLYRALNFGKYEFRTLEIPYLKVLYRALKDRA